MNSMTITSAKYEIGNQMIAAIIDGVSMSVPLDPANRHYDAIMAQVDAGDLVIQEADA